MVVRADSKGSIMIALWEKTAELRLGLASVNSVLAWTMKKKRFLSIESPGLTVASTDYGHMKAKSLIICGQNSNLNPK